MKQFVLFECLYFHGWLKILLSERVIINKEANRKFNIFPRFWYIYRNRLDRSYDMEKSIESLRFVYRPVIYSETGLLDFDWLFSGPRSSFDGLFHFRISMGSLYAFQGIRIFTFSLPSPSSPFLCDIAPTFYIHTRAKIIPFFFLAPAITPAITKTDIYINAYVYYFFFFISKIKENLFKRSFFRFKIIFQYRCSTPDLSTKWKTNILDFLIISAVIKVFRIIHVSKDDGLNRIP